MKFNSLGALGVLAFIVVWQAAVMVAAPQSTTIAAPLDILASLGERGTMGTLAAALGHTVLAALGGWFLAVVVGVVVGVAVGSSRWASAWSMSSIDFLRSLPPIALVAPMVLIFGFSLSMEMAVVFFGALWPVLINTTQGVRQVPRQVLETGRTLQLSGGTSLLRLTVPWAAPLILVGARLSLTLAIILAVVSEMVGNPQGIGYQIVFNQQALRPGHLYLYIVVAGFLAIAANAVLVRAARLVPAVSKRGVAA